MSWEQFDAAVRRCEDMVADAAPDAEAAEEGRGYVARLAASMLSSSLLGHLHREAGLTRPLPVNGGPNPDYRMAFAQIDPAGRYRLTGRLNGSERIGVGLYRPGRNNVPLERGYHAIDRDGIDSDGQFSLEIGESGLAIADDVRLLLIRVLHRDERTEPARLQLSGGPLPPPLSPGNADTALGFVAAGLERNVAEYLKWTAVALDRPNRLAPAPPDLAESAQGDPDTLYFIGGFDLSDSEWLEIAMPKPDARYWSIHAYSLWFEHLRIAGVTDADAAIDGEDMIRIALGPDTPVDAANRIDSGAHRRGALICRIIGDGRCPDMRVRRKP